MNLLCNYALKHIYITHYQCQKFAIKFQVCMYIGLPYSVLNYEISITRGSILIQYIFIIRNIERPYQQLLHLALLSFNIYIDQ